MGTEYELIFGAETVARVRARAVDESWIVGEVVELLADESLRRKFAMMVMDELPEFSEDDFEDGFLDDGAWFLRRDDGALLRISVPALREATGEVFWRWREA